MNYYDIYDQVAFSEDFESLESRDVFYSEYDLFSQSNDETIIADEVMSALGTSIDEEYLVYLLIKLDHVAYVPFGKAGAEQLDEIFKSRGQAQTFSQYKLMKFMETLHNNRVEISDNLHQALDDFISSYFNDKLDLSNPVHVAVLIRRLSTELENGIANGSIKSPVQKNKLLEQIIQSILSQMTPDSAEIDLTKYLPQLNTGKLNEKCKKYLSHAVSPLSESSFE